MGVPLTKDRLNLARQRKVYLNSTQINLSAEQILFQNYSLPALNDDLRRQLDLLILFIKKYIYSCKIKEINLDNSQFINKLKLQWKIENLI